MGRIGLQEIVLIALVVFIFFGAKNLPEIARGLGQAIREFRRAGKAIEDDVAGVMNNDAQKRS